MVLESELNVDLGVKRGRIQADIFLNQVNYNCMLQSGYQLMNPSIDFFFF